jgi:hypothetical protein
MLESGAAAYLSCDLSKSLTDVKTRKGKVGTAVSDDGQVLDA